MGLSHLVCGCANQFVIPHHSGLGRSSFGDPNITSGHDTKSPWTLNEERERRQASLRPNADFPRVDPPPSRKPRGASLPPGVIPACPLPVPRSHPGLQPPCPQESSGACRLPAGLPGGVREPSTRCQRPASLGRTLGFLFDSWIINIQVRAVVTFSTSPDLEVSLSIPRGRCGASLRRTPGPARVSSRSGCKLSAQGRAVSSPSASGPRPPLLPSRRALPGPPPPAPSGPPALHAVGGLSGPPPGPFPLLMRTPAPHNPPSPRPAAPHRSGSASLVARALPLPRTVPAPAPAPRPGDRTELLCWARSRRPESGAGAKPGGASPRENSQGVQLGFPKAGPGARTGFGRLFGSQEAGEGVGRVTERGKADTGVEATGYLQGKGQRASSCWELNSEPGRGAGSRTDSGPSWGPARGIVSPSHPLFPGRSSCRDGAASRCWRKSPAESVAQAPSCSDPGAAGPGRAGQPRPGGKGKRRVLVPIGSFES